MQITRKSMVSGVERTMDLNITQGQIDAYNRGTLLQDAFPNLTDAEREFFKSGITDEEWKATFGDDEDES